MTAGTQTNPGGQANSLADVKLVLADILDDIYQQESKTAMWTPNPAFVRGFQNAKTGQVATIATSGLGNYDMAKGYPNGVASMTFQDYSLKYDRGVSMLIDAVDLMQSENIPTASAVLAEFSRTWLIPELDSARISAVVERAKTASDQVKNGYKVDKSTFLSTIMDGLQVIEDNTGIDSGINILVNQKYGGYLKGSTEFTRTKNVESGLTSISNKIKEINDNPVTYVPSSRMWSAFDFKDGTTAAGVAGAGFAPNNEGLEVIALLTAPNTAQGIVAHQVTKILSPEQVENADGSKINFRVYHDCLVPLNKIPGVYAILSDKTPLTVRSTEAVQAAETGGSSSKKKTS